MTRDRDGLRQRAYGEQYVTCDGEKVSTDRFRCDVTDAARHIVSQDSDYAQGIMSNPSISRYQQDQDEEVV